MAAESTTFLARALDPEVEPPSDALSQRILDAALTLAAASGIRHLTMDDVARRARVGRMTVYRRFGDKLRLLEALNVREFRRCLAELEAAIGAGGALADQIAEGFVASLRIAREHPLLSRLARHEPEAVIDGFVANDGQLFAAARAFAAARLRTSAEADLLPVDIEEVAELLVRAGISFVLIPESVLPVDDEARARDFARSLVAPIVGGSASGVRRSS